MKLKKGITLEQLQAATKNSVGEPSVWFGSLTCWWTHDPTDLQRTHSIPTDSLGGVLYEGDIHKFLDNAINNSDRYGHLELEVFMAMHHKNFEPTPGDSSRLFATIEAFEMAILLKRRTEPDFTLLK